MGNLLISDFMISFHLDLYYHHASLDLQGLEMDNIQSKSEKLAVAKPQSRASPQCPELVIFSHELLLRRLWLPSIRTIIYLRRERPSPCYQRPIQRLNLRREAPERPIRGWKRKSEDADVLRPCIGKVMRSTCAKGPWYKPKPLGYTKWLCETFHCDRSTHGIRNRTEVEDEGARGWDSLPHDLQDYVLEKSDFKGLSRFKLLSKDCKQHVESDDFRRRRGAISEGSFTAFSYYIKNKAWQCTAYDLDSKSWRAFPTLSYLPTPDPELFKEYSVTGHGGLMCAEVSKLPKKGELVVFNPLTGEQRALPPLLHPRIPVLVHLAVNSSNHDSFKVIVAGSSTASDKHLSRKVEVFDSVTSAWTEACDLPGPAFGLNEHQGGVSVDGTLFLIAFLESGGRGVVAFQVETGKHRTCPIIDSCCCNTLQLVENGGKLYLFSERERGACVEHCIDELELLTWRWKNVVRVKRSGGRGLLVYPEQTCVGFGVGKLCIFNALNRDGVVYDMRDGQQCAVLEPPPPDQKGDNFFSLNPALFSLQPNFATQLYSSSNPAMSEI